MHQLVDVSLLDSCCCHSKRYLREANVHVFCWTRVFLMKYEWQVLKSNVVGCNPLPMFAPWFIFIGNWRNHLQITTMGCCPRIVLGCSLGQWFVVWRETLNLQGLWFHGLLHHLLGGRSLRQTFTWNPVVPFLGYDFSTASSSTSQQKHIFSHAGRWLPGEGHSLQRWNPFIFGFCIFVGRISTRFLAQSLERFGSWCEKLRFSLGCLNICIKDVCCCFCFWGEQICCWPDFLRCFFFPGGEGYHGFCSKIFVVPLPHHWSLFLKTVPLQSRHIHPEHAGARKCHDFSVCSMLHGKSSRVFFSVPQKEQPMFGGRYVCLNPPSMWSFVPT